MQNKIEQLECKMKKLARVNNLLLLGFFFIAVLFLYSFQNKKDKSIIRARGIIIEDSLGKERILIGAPVPFAKNRVRTDLAKVEAAWKKDFSWAPKYMEFYKNYNNNANGIIIMNEDGFDKVILGDPAPDPNFGTRLAPGSGVIINDDKGYERSGYSILKVDGKYRVVLGLDSKNGTEGAVLGLWDDGYAGLNIRNGLKQTFIGKAPANHMITKLNEKFMGVLSKDSSEVKFKTNLYDQK